MPLDPTGLMPAISAGLQLAAFAANKTKEAGEINVYTDRAKLFHELFDTEETDEIDQDGKKVTRPTEKAKAAYATLYSEMQRLCAVKGITPSVWYEGAPCLNIPVATLKEIMDASTK